MDRKGRCVEVTGLTAGGTVRTERVWVDDLPEPGEPCRACGGSKTLPVIDQRDGDLCFVGETACPVCREEE